MYSYVVLGAGFKVQSPAVPFPFLPPSGSYSITREKCLEMLLIPHFRALDAPLRVPIHHPYRPRPELKRHVAVVGVDGLFWLITAAAVRGPAWRASRGGV